MTVIDANNIFAFIMTLTPYSLTGLLRCPTLSKKPVIVPENQIIAIRKYINDYDENKKTQETCDLQEGQMVRIISGPMIGLEGKLISAKDVRKLVVYIEAVGQYLPVSIPRTKVEPIVGKA